MVEYHPISTKDQSRLHLFGKTVLLELFLGHALIVVRWIVKGDTLVAKRPRFREPTVRREQPVGSEVEFKLERQRWRWSPWTSAYKVTSSIDHNEPRVHLHVPKEETFLFRLKYNVTRTIHNSAKEVLTPNGENNIYIYIFIYIYIYISNSRWYSKIVAKRPRIPRTHCEAGTTVGSEDLSGELQVESGEVSTDRNKRWRWSPCRLLVDTRWLHLSSSQWTSSSSPCAERRNTSFFDWNTLMWPGLLTQIWMCCKKSVLMIIGMSTRIEVRQILGKDSRSSRYWRKNPPKGYMWSKTGRAAQRKEKQEWANEKSKLDNARRLRELLFHWSGRWRV